MLDSTKSSWNNVAQKYGAKFMDIEIYNHTYEAFYSALSTQTPNILEIGCGPGNITKHLLQDIPNAIITATDYASTMIEIAQKKVISTSVSFEVIDCREMDFPENQFDAMVIGFCIPYLNQKELERLLLNCHRWITEGGVIYLSFIEGEYENSGFQTSSDGKNSMKVHYYESKNVTEYMKNIGFILIEEFSVEYPLGNGQIDQHSVLICRK